MPKKRILISDNSKDFVQLLVQYFLSRPGIEIVGVAYDGNQTLQMIKQTKPDVLLLDIIMPGMDGLEVARNINKSENKLKIIIISAVGNEQIHEMAINCGAEHYFIKPVKLNEVLEAIS
jgi:two-component system response regulator (stage 0 sporulation protein A)